MEKKLKQNRESHFLGDYIDGRFVLGEESKIWTLVSPSDFKDQVVEKAVCSFSHLDQALSVARKAFQSWRSLSFEKRKEKLLKLKDIFEKNVEKTALMISRETGKPLWESILEAKALSSKISVTLEYSFQLVKKEKISNVFPGVEGFIFYRPRGVLAILGPFNFPAHLPIGHMVPALLMGNTVLFKPSEKTPLTGQWLAQMIDQAGFPKGVFNLLQGDALMGKKIVEHREVDAILFTGSYPVGKKIKEQVLDHHWKLLALEMGGKNTSIVWKDAFLKKALYENILGAFLTSGQRCSATSQIAVHEEIFDEFLDQFRKQVKNIKIGYWKDPVFMGPLIDEASFERHFEFQDLACKEGAEVILEGKPLEFDIRGHYVSPSLVYVKNQDLSSKYQQSEIFTPSLAFYKIYDFEEGLNLFHASGYGLALSIFSKEKTLYQKALEGARSGLIHWNRSTSGASSRLPFGGRGKSGNDRPAGHFSIQYCSVPVASLQDPNPLDQKKNSFPGLNFDFSLGNSKIV